MNETFGREKRCGTHDFYVGLRCAAMLQLHSSRAACGHTRVLADAAIRSRRSLARRSARRLGRI